MADEIVTPDTASIELIREVFDAALMDAVLDDDRKFVRLREEVQARVYLSDARDRLQLVAYYGIKEDAQRADRLELVNRINDTYLLVRAAIDEDEDLCLDYTVVLKGGVTRRAIVQAARAFLTLVPRAVNECDEDGIVE